MLIVKRASGESIQIGKKQEVVITVLHVDKGTVEIGINAPRSIPVDWHNRFNKRSRRDRKMRQHRDSTSPDHLGYQKYQPE